MYDGEKFFDACSKDFVRFGSLGWPGVLAVSEHYQRTRDPWVERRTDEGAGACRWNSTREALKKDGEPVLSNWAFSSRAFSEEA